MEVIERKVFMELITLQTKHTTYQMGIAEHGFLLHLYYGPKAEGDMSYLLIPSSLCEVARRSIGGDTCPAIFLVFIEMILGSLATIPQK